MEDNIIEFWMLLTTPSCQWTKLVKEILTEARMGYQDSNQLFLVHETEQNIGAMIVN